MSVVKNGRSYFFDEGLRFECTQCGFCCTGGPGRVRVTKEEIQAIADYTGRSPESFLRNGEDGSELREASNGDCILFAGGQCTVHAVKPKQCRLYPFWFKNLRSVQAWEKTAAECPGIGKGRQYTREEILELVGQDLDGR